MGPNEVPVVWPMYTEDQKEYMVFGPGMAVTQQDENRQNRYYFWNVIFQELAIPKTSVAKYNCK